MSALERHTERVKSIAVDLGFMNCRISKSEFLESEALHLENWLKSQAHGEMQYMENHFDKRLDPRLLVPGSKSVVSLAYNYFPKELNHSQSYKVSKYAWGEDYHLVIKEKLFEFVERIREEIGDVHGRVFVDSAPVLEKAWAVKSGVGWIGKNANVITKGAGSFFFLAELILDLELVPDSVVSDHCGTCTACIDACPTNAIVADHVVDGSKCISYFTIELKQAVPEEWKSKLDDWIFGCDVCQDVCPWNKFSKPHAEPRFDLKDLLRNKTKQDWLEMTEEVFMDQFGDSPLMRPGLKKIQSHFSD
ncbi:MAG: tRNA epoxyqueuosine(34) reductase QueG [Bacteroidota bacterium]